MNDRDPAFMWETEALRAAPHRVAEEEVDNNPEVEPSGRWMTLRDANRATGIPVETLRKWARRGTIPTYLQATQIGTNIRLVDLDGVEERAAELGRTINADADTAEPTTSQPAPPDVPPAEAAAPGTMIVPVDAWNKMLTQLGNLHEAGQQLATARERAAKAETEAGFLRERLAEMRAELVTARTGQTPPITEIPADGPTPEPAPEPPAAPPEKVWQYFVRRLRARS